MNIVKATTAYEHWLGKHLFLVEDDLNYKHEQMGTSPFAFFRATYYRWVQVSAKALHKYEKAPVVLSVGDLHIENFGTWRDAEGRLIWGVNDFDEAFFLSFTDDLIRLATSVVLAANTQNLAHDLKAACQAIMFGYLRSLEAGGQPFVLEEEHHSLREMATGSLRDPVRFWGKMLDLPTVDGIDQPSACAAVEATLPATNLDYAVRHRRAGLGSLGRPRYVVTAEWSGGHIAREAKGLAPSAVVWATDQKGPHAMLYQTILDRAKRCKDPYVQISGTWLVRRLAPDCSRIVLGELPTEDKEAKLLEAMGYETANVHLGSSDKIADCRRYLEGLPKNWLREAALKMSESVADDFAAWKKG